MIPFIDLEGGFLTDEELLFLAGASGGGGVEHTIINNPATFTTDMAKPLRRLLIPFTPVQSGSGDPSPTNIRPITGWTGLNINRTGVNFCGCEWESGTINSETGANYDDGTQKFRTNGYFAIVGGLTYNVVDESRYKRVYWYDKDKIYISSHTTSSSGKTAPANACFARAVVEGDKTPNPEETYSFNFPSTETEYFPYSGTTVPVSWQTEAGTVYGGTLDALTGTLTVEWAYADMGLLEWTYNSAQLSMVSNSLVSVCGDGQHLLCSNYKLANSLQGAALAGLDKVIAINKASTKTTGNFAPGVLVVKDTNYTDANTFKTAMNGVSLVYELATPQTVQLDPVTLSTLIGENVLWTDTNGDNTIVYLKKT